MSLRETISSFARRSLAPVYAKSHRRLMTALTMDALTHQIAVSVAYYVSGRWDEAKFDEWVVEVSGMFSRAGVDKRWREKLRSDMRGLLGFFAGHYGVALSSALHETLALRHPIYESFTVTCTNAVITVTEGRPTTTPTVTVSGDGSVIAQVLSGGLAINRALRVPQKFRTSSPEDLIQFLTGLKPAPPTDDLAQALKELPRRVDGTKIVARDADNNSVTMRSLKVVLGLNAETGASQELTYRVELAARHHGVPADEIAWLLELLREPAPRLVGAPPTDDPETPLQDPEGKPTKAPKPRTTTRDEDLTQEHINTLWGVVRARLPLTIERFFSGWTAAWDVDGKFHPVRVFPTRGNRVQFGVDVDEARLVAPLSARNWTNAQLIDGLVEAAMLYFLQATQMLVPGKMDRFLGKYVKHDEVARVIDNLNELAQVVIKDDQEAHSLLDLDRQLRERFGDPNAATAAAEWLAKHTQSLLTKFSDRRMIPLFTRWVVEAMQDIVANRRVRPDVPQVLVDFLMQTFVLSGSSAWRRDVLHQSLQRLAELERQLRALVDAGVSEAREILAEVENARAAFLPR